MTLHNGGMNQREIAIQCPECGFSQIRKKGQKKGKQNHICVNCGRQFIDHDDLPKGYLTSSGANGSKCMSQRR